MKDLPLQVIVCHYRYVNDGTQRAIDGLFNDADSSGGGGGGGGK